MCSGPKKGGKAAETTPGYSLFVYSITEAPPLPHDHDGRRWSSMVADIFGAHDRALVTD